MSRRLDFDGDKTLTEILPKDIDRDKHGLYQITF